MRDSTDPRNARLRGALVRAGRGGSAPTELRARVMAIAPPIAAASAAKLDGAVSSIRAKANGAAPSTSASTTAAGPGAVAWKLGGWIAAAFAVATASLVATMSTSYTSPPPSAPSAVAMIASPPAPPVPTSVDDPSPPMAIVEPPPPVSEVRMKVASTKAKSRVSEVDPQPTPWKKPPTTNRVAEEMQHIEQIRSAVNAGAHTRALQLLEEYRVAFPTGVLSEEAEAMRIETLSRLGRTRAAAELGRRFLNEHPSSPLTGTVQATLASLPKPPSED